MNTGKNRVKGLKTELFKKKYQTNPVVQNPSEELKTRGLTDVVGSALQSFESDMEAQREYFKQRPLRINTQRKYTPEEIARMKKNFPMSAEDFQVANAYGISGLPDLTAGQDVNDTRTQDQILGETEQTTSTPRSLINFQNSNFNQRVEGATKEALNSTDPTWLDNAWDVTKDFVKDTDWREVTRMGVGLTSAARGIYEDSRTRQDLAERVQNLNDRARYMPNEYEYMGRPGSQSVIYAKDGAQIRTGTSSGAEEAELERGEMFMLPNLETYTVGGKKHSQGGEDFVLPEGTIVFSDYLKVPGTKNTFSAEAKKFDITKYKEILENPHSKAVDRDTAEVMMDRNMKKLQQLFQVQQSMNGNSNGEVKEGEKRIGQVGFINQTQPTTWGPNAPMALTPEQQKQYYLNQGMFNNPNYQQETAAIGTAEKKAITQQAKKVLGLQEYTEFQVEEAEKNKIAAAAKPIPSGVLGAAPQTTPNTTTNIVKEQARANETGTVGKTNAADPSSMYYRTLPNGRKVFVEGQGEFKDKKYRDQYGGDVWNLVRNRLNESYEQLNPLLLSAYQMQLKDKSLNVKSGEELVDIMEGGNNSLVAMRNFYKSIGAEQELFDPALDKGADDNMKQKKTAQLLKQYVESPQFLADVAAGKASAVIPWLKNQPVAIKDRDGKVTGYKLDNAEMNQKYVQQYQAAYRAFGGVKSNMPKEKDLLKGFRITPEGLSDHQWMGLPISPVDEWGGNTTIGQISAFEDEEAVVKKKEDPAVKDKDPGKDYNKIIDPATMGKFEKEPFDYPQLSPEIYGMAASQMFPYAPMDYNAPYLMPQTLNIQPQLQDVDNSYMAAINSGADPNSALIATLGAKQKLFSEKQNFDAQQRAAADQYNANARWQEDVYDMQSLDNVYNTLIADADDAVTAQRQALIQSASDKRASWRMEESRKQFWYNNFVKSFDYDAKTRSLVVKKDANKEFINMLNNDMGTGFGIPEVNTTAAPNQSAQTTTTTQ